MRRVFLGQLSALLFVGLAMAAQANNAAQDDQSPVNAPADNKTQGPPPPTGNPEITVIGKAPHEPPLPALPPDEFSDCMRDRGALDLSNPSATAALAICSAKLDWERRTVIDKCINQDGKSGPPVVIQACTESLDHKILQGRDRIYIFVNRAEAYFTAGDKQHALDDYNEAVKLAPQNAKLYFNRGVFYAAQPDGEAALRDFNAALAIDPKFVPALQERAKMYQTQSDFSGALADYSEAIRLQPKNAALWSERGYVCIRQHDYQSAVKDEAEAIRLDPKLARAYFLRGAAFGDLGNSSNAVSDIVTAVGLDPSLDRYVSTKGKTASIALPPL
jgi:tetratricopeptide (TPR) repeat protein